MEALCLANAKRKEEKNLSKYGPWQCVNKENWADISGSYIMTPMSLH